MEQLIQSSIQDSIQAKQRLLESPELLSVLQKTAEATIRALKNGGKVLLCGNGGSASDAQHLAGEFVSRFRFDRPALPAVALNCNASILTSIGNDYEYRLIFQRQVEALGHPLGLQLHRPLGEYPSGHGGRPLRRDRHRGLSGRRRRGLSGAGRLSPAGAKPRHAPGTGVPHHDGAHPLRLH